MSTLSLSLTLLAIELLSRILPWAGEPTRSTAVRADAISRPPQPDFRTRRYVLARRPDVVRIVVTGDSFAWGHGVHPEDAFPDRLEVRLRERGAPRRFEVINWSRPGWNTVQQYRSLRDHLDDLSPDQLIVSFVLNDAQPTERRAANELMRAAGVFRREPTRRWSASLARHSRLYAWAWTRLENSRQRRAMGSFYRALFEGEHWRQCRAALRRIRDEARRRSIGLLLVVFPVFDSQLDERYAYRPLHARVGEAAEELGIPVLDLLEVYAGIDGRLLAAFPFTDPHPSELAHRLAADAILERLAREGRLLGDGRGSRQRTERSPEQQPAEPR